MIASLSMGKIKLFFWPNYFNISLSEVPIYSLEPASMISLSSSSIKCVMVNLILLSLFELSSAKLLEGSLLCLGNLLQTLCILMLEEILFSFHFPSNKRWLSSTRKAQCLIQLILDQLLEQELTWLSVTMPTYKRQVTHNSHTLMGIADISSATSILQLCSQVRKMVIIFW